ncbi:hypothetical protein BTJ40_00375 [Microbulbifer sp. A4B17]|uniref:4'-phosphopantetheinyl transferase family protein n=1 Tax=Microbulbifer sp. A4B17 TaxID=359370 RepID=UPI000D52D2AE|nr:4'-phosphopantetheinyl transferase superfamily protein [Microbulbifer sp. A4B17]AWF79405.1 hypothetical protein BTJ40_00375 [Microbulbifer sp. A4B17]
MFYFTCSSFENWPGYWQEESIQLLGSSEISRLGKINNSKRRAQFLAGRLLLRTLVAEQYGCPLSKIALEAEAPRVASTQGKPLCHVSISHSASFIAVAAAKNPVGIDCEHENRQRNWLAIANQYFHKAEFIELNSLPKRQAAIRFLTQWTSKEALAKCSGIDLGKLLASVPILQWDQQLDQPHSSYLFWSGQPKPGTCLSLAVKHSQASSVAYPMGTYKASHNEKAGESIFLKRFSTPD